MNLPQLIIKMFQLGWYFILASLRNPSAIFFGFAFPLIFVSIFSLIGQNGASYNVGVLSSSIKSGPVWEAVQKIDVLKLKTDISDDELKQQLSKGQIPALLEIKQATDNPPSYSINLQTTSASPQDGQIVRSILENLTNQFNLSANPNSFKIATLDISNVEGRKFNAVDFILPGQLSFALLGTAVFGLAFSLITMRKTLVLKRLNATSIPNWVILGGRVISSMFMAVLQAVVIILVGYLFFNFTLINGIWTFVQMVLLSVFGLLTFMSFGLLIPAIAKSEEAANPITNLITLPQFLLSGTFFSTSILPPWLANFAGIMPMYFLNEALRKVAFEGAGFETILKDVLGLLAWAVVCYAVAFRFFKWE
ncbi:MAG: hypothetical protein OHK0017_03580 [Patescibacteria group bacterium]